MRRLPPLLPSHLPNGRGPILRFIMLRLHGEPTTSLHTRAGRCPKGLEFFILGLVIIIIYVLIQLRRQLPSDSCWIRTYWDNHASSAQPSRPTADSLITITLKTHSKLQPEYTLICIKTEVITH